MKKAKIFMNGQSQAVRLPKEFRFNEDEVSVQKYGDGILILPIAKSLFAFRNSIKKFSDDFMNERNQPEMQKRDDF
jgi:antitoxin VapB